MADGGWSGLVDVTKPNYFTASAGAGGGQGVCEE